MKYANPEKGFVGSCSASSGRQGEKLRCCIMTYTLSTSMYFILIEIIRVHIPWRLKSMLS